FHANTLQRHHIEICLEESAQCCLLEARRLCEGNIKSIEENPGGEVLVRQFCVRDLQEFVNRSNAVFTSGRGGLVEGNLASETIGHSRDGIHSDAGLNTSQPCCRTHVVQRGADQRLQR